MRPNHTHEPLADFWGIGTAVAAATNLIGTFATNSSNKKIWKKQMEWQTDMDNTKYQRTVSDLAAAGLNPMLAYSNGPSASTPSNSPPTMQAPDFMGAAKGIADVMNAGQQMEQSAAQTEQLKAQTQKVQSETIDRSINTAQAAAQVQKTYADTANSGASATSLLQSAKNAESSSAGIIAETNRKVAQLEADKKDFDGDNAFSARASRERSKADEEASDAFIRRNQIPGSRNEAGYQNSALGQNKVLDTILRILGGASSAKSAMR